MILNANISDSSNIESLLFQSLKQIIQNNRNDVLKGAQQTSFVSNMQSADFQHFIASQFQMISKQSQVLDQIKQEIIKKKSNSNHQAIFCRNNNNMDILPIQSSFDMSNISLVQAYEEEPFKTKFGEQFQRSLVSSALNQVQQNCSSETYEAVKNCVFNSKQKQYEIANQKLQSLRKKFDQIETSFIIKSTQLSQTQSQLKESLSRLQLLDQQKRKLKLKNNQVSQKQKRIYKMQTSLVFKQKLLHEGKKRYQREKNQFLNIQNRLNKLYQQINGMWESILLKMESAEKFGCLTSCENTAQNGGPCWKKEVMKKCRQQLIDQRNLLKQQEEAIQKQYEMIHLFSDQVRKLVNQKDAYPSHIDPFQPELSSMIIQSPSKI